ncbi:MAG: OmpA/MotB domain protein [Bacteroidetes bacterium]|nr:OmpA/MotB domain protein [Bacteroidota bacterium]
MAKHTFTACWILVICVLIQSCGPMARLKRADKKYDIGEYYTAGNLYRKAYSTLPLNKKQIRAYAAFQQGECFRIINKPSKAINAYAASIKGKYKDSIVYLQYARVLHENGNYGEALKMYQTYLKAYPNNQLANNGTTACQKLSEWQKIKTDYVVQRAGEFNSKNASDFSPVFADAEGSSLMLASSRTNTTIRKPSNITGIPQNDLYLSQKNVAGKWEKPQPIEGGFNTDFDEGAASVTADGKTVYFTRCPYEEDKSLGAQIFVSNRSGGQWTEPKQVILFKDSSITAAHPAINASGDTLYFVSDKKGGYGGKDIWMSVNERGIWKTPKNLGPTINTTGDEMFPYAHPDGSLYFSSNGHPGLGGLDIFHATRVDATTWNVVNLMPPFNSNGDDFGITFEGKKPKGYFSSNRGESKGYDKIWSFNLPEKEYALAGIVSDNHKQILGDAIIRIIGTNGANVKLRTKKDGTFYYKVEPNVDYVLLATCRGFLNQRNQLSTQGLKESKIFKVAFQLTPVGKPITLNNIFFEFGKWTLTKESETSLNGLVKILKDNPNITIELAAHTDMIGTAETNQVLSEKRIQTVVDFLAQAGIAKDRISGKGYGASVPVTVDANLAATYPFLKEGTVLNEAFIKSLNSEQQEIANKINRRTEFRVIKTTYGLK